MSFSDPHREDMSSSGVVDAWKDDTFGYGCDEGHDVLSPKCNVLNLHQMSSVSANEDPYWDDLDEEVGIREIGRIYDDVLGVKNVRFDGQFSPGGKGKSLDGTTQIHIINSNHVVLEEGNIVSVENGVASLSESSSSSRRMAIESQISKEEEDGSPIVREESASVSLRSSTRSVSVLSHKTTEQQSANLKGSVSKQEAVKSNNDEVDIHEIYQSVLGINLADQPQQPIAQPSSISSFDHKMDEVPSRSMVEETRKRSPGINVEEAEASIPHRKVELNPEAEEINAAEIVAIYADVLGVSKTQIEQAVQRTKEPFKKDISSLSSHRRSEASPSKTTEHGRITDGHYISHRKATSKRRLDVSGNRHREPGNLSAQEMEQIYKDVLGVSNHFAHAPLT